MTDSNVVGFRVSPQQSSIWRTQEGGLPAAVQCVFTLPRDMNLDRLREASLTAAARHEIFRTRFQRTSGLNLPFQVVEENLLVSFVQVGGPPEPAALNLDDGPVLEFVVSSISPESRAFRITASTLCADAVTLRNLACEIASIYSGSPLADPPLQYADAAEWLNGLLASENEASEYLRKLDFLSVPTPLLPLEDRLVEPAFGNVESYDFHLAPSANPDFLLACWCTLLWKLTGQPDIPVVRIADGRTRPELRAAAGVFARPVPVVAHFSEVPAFDAILRQVAETPRIEDFIAPDDVLGGQMRIGFEYVEAASAAFRLESISAPLYPLKAKLTCADSGKASIEYHALLDRAEVARIAAFFERLVREASADPQRRVDQFEIISDDERWTVTEKFNQTQADYALDLCYHQMFEQQVERVPERIALVFGEEKPTYRQLNARANRVAHYLRAQGVAAGSRVGLFIERSADMIVALLGILKAGGAYVPLHPHAPTARLAQQLADTAVTVLITQTSLLHRLPAIDCRIFCQDRDLAKLSSHPESNPEPLAKPTDPIYVIFTSGSTGTPKAVVTRHANVVNYTQAISRILKLDDPSNAAGLTFGNVSTLTADLGNTNIFAALASGGALHMIPDDVLMDSALYAKYTAAEPIDILKIAPSHLRTLLAAGAPEKILPRYYLVVGGERLTWDMVRQIKKEGRCRILNHYSPTETTIGALTLDAIGSEHLAAYAAVVPLGRGIGNTLLYVLDRNLKPVPVGVPGELLIGGAGVSNGYLNRPELTAERFVLDPVHPESGRLFYRSGDRARWLPGGVVEFLGREDDQVKIRGFRVELGEIEAVLAKHPSVNQAVVILKEHPPAGEMLIACLIAPDRPAENELRDFLRRQLPDYMVPAHFVIMDSFPLNANGKADRRALAASVHPVAAPPSEPAQPAGKIEESLLAIWREVLHRPDIGVNDDFFDLGGHSLLATLVISRARAAFDVEIPLRVIFEAPTVAGMAKHIEHSMHELREEAELARLLKEVEGLSEEEVRRLLEHPAESGDGLWSTATS